MKYDRRLRKGDNLSRQPRIHYEGALYHIIVRGNNRSYIFRNDANKIEYLNIIKRYKRKYNFKIYSYCIMDNHAHLLIEVSEIPLSKIMQGIQQVFTWHYHNKNGTTGHIFEQRYKAFLCNKDSYLLSLIRYIHRNPINSELQNALNYSFSSHREYCENPRIVDVDLPLNIFSPNRSEAISRYLSFMEEDENTKITEMFLANPNKSNSMKSAINNVNLDKEKLIELIEKVTSTPFNSIKGNIKTKRIADIRKLYILCLHEFTNLNKTEIARLLEIKNSTVSNVTHSRFQENGFIRENKHKIEKNVKL
ncbi:MAG: transposase [Atribacterota bacterium]